MKTGRFLALIALVGVLVMFLSCESGNGNGIKLPADSIQIVNIGGIKWTTANLTADAGATSGHRVASAPNESGSYFKWGSRYTYDATNVGEGWGGQSTGAAAKPQNTTTGYMDYDYAKLSGGTAHPGDPCKSLGDGYRTPTHRQWMNISQGTHIFGNYQGASGRFFGPGSNSCTSTTIIAGCIFIPDAGLRSWDNGSLQNEGRWGRYWSSTAYSYTVSYACHTSPLVNYNSQEIRGYGFSVRCIKE